MHNSLSPWVNLAKGMPLTQCLGFLHICPHRSDGSVNPFHQGMCLVRCPYLSHLAFCKLCLKERLVVIDANCSILSPEQIIPSTLCPRVAKAKLPRIPLAAAKIAYPNQPIPPRNMVNKSYAPVAGSFLGMPTPGQRVCSYFIFCCTVGLASKQGSVVS